ncbi:MAG: hypothetical protein KAU10_07275 [Dehalococcoidia bacterium]|nr:hypothetical protein [Dehalococcoidia bacterium]
MELPANGPDVVTGDGSFKALQGIRQPGLDITMVLCPIVNAFGAEREEIARLVAEYPSGA